MTQVILVSDLREYIDPSLHTGYDPLANRLWSPPIDIIVPCIVPSFFLVAGILVIFYCVVFLDRNLSLIVLAAMITEHIKCRHEYVPLYWLP